MLCWIFILGICSISYCAAEDSVRYQERGNVQFVPIATTPSSQAVVENDIKIMKEQINSLLKQRDYDRYLICVYCVYKCIYLQNHNDSIVQYMHVWKSLNFIIIINFKKFIFKIFMILPKFNYNFILLRKLFTIKVLSCHNHCEQLQFLFFLRL